MRNIKRIYLIIVMILLASFILIACGKEASVNETIKDMEGKDDITKVVETEDNTETDKAEDKDTSKDKDSKNEWNTEANIPAMHLGVLNVSTETIYEEDFEGEEHGFTGRVNEVISLSKEYAYQGTYSLYTTNREASWNGPIVDITDKVSSNKTYSSSAYVMYQEGPEQMEIDCQIEMNGDTYLNFGSALVKKGEWTEIKGQINLPSSMKTARLYFEVHYGTESENFISFYVDNIAITQEEIVAERGEIPSLKELYKDYFTIGFASTVSEAQASIHPLLKEQFNSLTFGNELKPDSVLDYERCISNDTYDDNPAIHFKNADYLLKFAQDAKIPVRGHTLVWHAQTPRWFFAVGYSKDENAPLVSRELMLKRMENYIKNVLEYAETNYPGLIYAWDVVNEAIEVADGEENWIRSKDNYWYQTVGNDYVIKAFEYARKYANPNVLLFYNDYNTEDPSKVVAICRLVDSLKEKGYIDGIGLQNHIGMDSPSLTNIESSIRKYAEFGLEIHITELDVSLTDNSEESLLKQASRYKRFFTLMRHLKKSEAANITNVTFWGITDATSWLNKPGVPNYPLLFDKYAIQKPAFWGVALSKDIPLN